MKELEKKFEEQFPSISNQGWSILTQVVSYARILDKDDKSMIQKHCLDKTKVIKAINKLSETIYSGVDENQDDIYVVAVEVSKLKKELGLK